MAACLPACVHVKNYKCNEVEKGRDDLSNLILFPHMNAPWSQPTSQPAHSIARAHIIMHSLLARKSCQWQAACSIAFLLTILLASSTTLYAQFWLGEVHFGWVGAFFSGGNRRKCQCQHSWLVCQMRWKRTMTARLWLWFELKIRISGLGGAFGCWDGKVNWFSRRLKNW